ncbi:hypothetical protein GALL_499050 [mine drainage metagenome]|uniref:Uncharacterized protein n=1 Tax=mine drainage metagenome TaxID=410659 RepID=A0A1J5PB30_9ZZZZ
MSQQPLTRGNAKALQVQRRAHGKRPAGTHGVKARQKAADPLKDLTVIEFGVAPAPVRADAEGKAAKVVQCGTLQQQRGNHRNFGIHQLGGKGMFFQNLGIRPATGPVKLGYHQRAVFQVQLVNPVFIRAQRHLAPVAIQANTGQCILHQIGGKYLVGVVHAPIMPETVDLAPSWVQVSRTRAAFALTCSPCSFIGAGPICPASRGACPARLQILIVPGDFYA